MSRVIDTQSMFFDAKSFNQPLDAWDVSNVKSMYKMFYKAESFNQSVANWNVAKLTSDNTVFPRNFERKNRFSLNENKKLET